MNLKSNRLVVYRWEMCIENGFYESYKSVRGLKEENIVNVVFGQIFFFFNLEYLYFLVQILKRL